MRRNAYSRIRELAEAGPKEFVVIAATEPVDVEIFDSSRRWSLPFSMFEEFTGRGFLPTPPTCPGLAVTAVHGRPVKRLV
ncbi:MULTISPECIES: hypothetical protein [Rhodococcus]|uniref:hypothetical protein n=1 Tax=Rhodococcus TaxID=1827 RepID=UPI00374E3FE7|nr:hypothetical protein HJ581_0040675 [Rhodococcus opacus]